MVLESGDISHVFDWLVRIIRIYVIPIFALRSRLRNELNRYAEVPLYSHQWRCYKGKVRAKKPLRRAGRRETAETIPTNASWLLAVMLFSFVFFCC